MNVRLDPSSEYFLNSLRRLQGRFETVQRQVSSGIRVEKVSDAPARISDIFGRESDLTRSQQVRESLGRVRAEVDASEQALQKAVSLIERAIVIGTQAATDLSAPNNRYAILAEEIAGLHEELVRLSNSTVEGRFVFGGDVDQQPPYQGNPASVDGNGVDQLTVASATKQALGVDGSRFAAGRTAQEIFDARGPGGVVSPENAFAAVQALLTAALNEDPAAARLALTNLEAAHEHLNSQLAFYGSLQNRVAGAVSQSYTLETRLQAELSDIRDADLASAAVEMARLQNGIQVAIQSQSTFRTPTLFDFIR